MRPIGSRTAQGYQREMEGPIKDMQQYLDGILYLHEEGRTKVSLSALFESIDQAK